MFSKLFRLQRAGQPIQARTLNRPIAEAERLNNLMAGAPLAIVQSADAPLLHDSAELSFYVQLTSGSGTGPYAWVRQYWSSGSWHNGFESSNTTQDPAYNTVNLTPTLPSVVRVTRRDGTLFFTAGSC